MTIHYADPTFDKKTAFSLIELLITLALVAIIITFTIPRTTFFSRFLVQAEINKLYAVFSYLQQRAIAGNESQELSFNLKNNTYQFKTVGGEVTTQKLPKSITFDFLPGAKGPPSHPDNPIVIAATFPIHNGTPIVSFMTNGKITPGTIYIIDGGKRCLGALTCPISQVSYIRRYTYDNQHWKNF
jgi:prepilin-type N-terminal cleavage/methylation domain-containing protein